MMNIEDFREFCLSLNGAVERTPWTKEKYRDLITFSVGDKWFALLDPNERITNLKCDPEKVIELTEKYKGCVPAWHMNKTHWIGVCLDSDVPVDVISAIILDSYRMIVASLSRKTREALKINFPS